MRVRNFLLGLALLCIAGGGPLPGDTRSANAQSAVPPGVMPLPQIKAALDVTSTKWVVFRNYNGRQWIYFTQILSWHCGLKEVRYSLNGDGLGELFPVPVCNPQTPFHLNPEKNKTYLNLALGSVKSLAVQLVYVDGSESPVRRFGPCDVEGDTTCGLLLQ